MNTKERVNEMNQYAVTYNLPGPVGYHWTTTVVAASPEEAMEKLATYTLRTLDGYPVKAINYFRNIKQI